MRKGVAELNIIECSGCTKSFQDSVMWWNGYFWYCPECVSYMEEEIEEEEELCSCHDGEINIYCQGCF